MADDLIRAMADSQENEIQGILETKLKAGKAPMAADGML